MDTKKVLIIVTALVLVVVAGVAFQDTLSKSKEEADTSRFCKVEDPLKADDPTAEKKLLPKGVIAPDFTLSTKDGTSYTLKDFRGKKKVLLEMFATWCPHCQHSVPAVENLHKKYADDVEFLAINAGNFMKDAQPSEAFAKQYGMTSAILEEPPTKLLNNYCMSRFPTFYLLDRKGKIIWTYKGTLEAGSEPLKELEEKLQ